jgi:hypothetical protein
MLLDILDDIFLLNLTLETAEGAFDRFAVLHFHFSHCYEHPLPAEFPGGLAARRDPSQETAWEANKHYREHGLAASIASLFARSARLQPTGRRVRSRSVRQHAFSCVPSWAANQHTIARL